MKTFI
jgi:hypothetical protein